MFCHFLKYYVSFNPLSLSCCSTKPVTVLAERGGNPWPQYPVQNLLIALALGISLWLSALGTRLNMFCQGVKEESWPSPGYGASGQEGREDILAVFKKLSRDIRPGS